MGGNKIIIFAILTSNIDDFSLFQFCGQWKVMHELDYELTLVETIRDCFENLEMETCSKMKVCDTRLADPESHEDVRKLIGQHNKNTKKLRHGLLLCGENGMYNVFTWEHQSWNCNATWTFEVWGQRCGYRLIIW